MTTFNIRSSQKAIGSVTMSSTASLDLHCSPTKERKKVEWLRFN